MFQGGFSGGYNNQFGQLRLGALPVPMQQGQSIQDRRAWNQVALLNSGVWQPDSSVGVPGAGVINYGVYGSSGGRPASDAYNHFRGNQNGNIGRFARYGNGLSTQKLLAPASGDRWTDLGRSSPARGVVTGMSCEFPGCGFLSTTDMALKQHFTRRHDPGPQNWKTYGW